MCIVSVHPSFSFDSFCIGTNNRSLIFIKTFLNKIRFFNAKSFHFFTILSLLVNENILGGEPDQASDAE